MDKEEAIKLLVALYRVTELFDKREPIKFFLRKTGNEILSRAVLFFLKENGNLNKEERKRIGGRILREIEKISAYFEVAERQNWVKKENFLILKQEYNKMKKEITETVISLSGKEGAFGVENKKENLQIDRAKSERCQKILEFLKGKEGIQVKDLKQVFPSISKRTLRRDFDYLLQQGIVERLGQANSTVYKLKNK